MKSKTNGAIKQAHKDRHGLRSIQFDEITDYGGTRTRIFYEDEAEWALVAESVVVQEGGPAAPPLIMTPGAPPPPSQAVVLHTLFYQIRVMKPKPGSSAAVIMVPVSRVRGIHVPCEIVTMRTPAGDRLNMVPVPMAREMRAKQEQAARERLPAIGAPTEPTEH